MHGDKVSPAASFEINNSTETKLEVGYELGLNKIVKNSFDSKCHTSTVGVAYMFCHQQTLDPSDLSEGKERRKCKATPRPCLFFKQKM